MKTIIFLIIIFIGTPYTAIGQKDTIRATFSKEERKILFNEIFTSTLSDVPSNSIGNYANVDVTEATASFSTSFVRNGSVFGFNINGGTNDGTLRFINNNRLNYNLEVGVQYHFIDHSKKPKFVIDRLEWQERKLGEAKILKDFQKKINDINEGENIKPLIVEIKGLEERIIFLSNQYEYYSNLGLFPSLERLKDQIKVIEERILDAKGYQNNTRAYINKKAAAIAQLSNCFTKNCIEKRIAIEKDRDVIQTLIEKPDLEKELKDLQKKRDEITNSSRSQAHATKILKLEKEIIGKQKIIDSITKLKSFLAVSESKKRQAALEKHDEKGFKTYGSSFNWFSIGASIKLNSFTLFDSNLPLSEQLDVREADNYELRLQYSWHKNYELKGWKSYLIHLGASITLGDNLNRLSRQTLEDTNLISEVENIIRSSSSETNVFVGEYQDDIAGMRLYADAYYFLFSGNYAALHLYPNVQLLQEEKPVFNTEIGLVLSFKDSKKSGSTANAEVFYAFNDIGNMVESNLNFLSRNTIGLRLTLPIKFNYKP